MLEIKNTKGYSLKFNEKRKCWIGAYRDPSLKWKVKFLPKQFKRQQRLEAEIWLDAWYREYLGNGGLAPEKKQIKPSSKTLALLFPMWLEFRFKDPGTKPRTYKSFQETGRNWIMDNDRFEHDSIQNLDIETELDVAAVRSWILSMGCGNPSKIANVSVLRTMINESIYEGWLSEDFSNPMNKPPILKLMREMMFRHKQNAKRSGSFLSKKEMSVLLKGFAHRIDDLRRIKYLVALATGMREGEIEGLIWGDIVWTGKIPYVVVERQLDKRGILPALKYDELVNAGMSKFEMAKCRNAIVSNPKKGSKRAIPMHPLLVRALKWWKTKGWIRHVGFAPKNEHPVFARGTFPNGTGVVPGSFQESDCVANLTLDLEALGLPTSKNGSKIVFHSLRHTFATQLDRAGVDEARIGVLMGHGAGSVARSTYIASGALEPNYQAILKLPLPRQVRTSSGSFLAKAKNGLLVDMGKYKSFHHLAANDKVG